MADQNDFRFKRGSRSEETSNKRLGMYPMSAGMLCRRTTWVVSSSAVFVFGQFGDGYEICDLGEAVNNGKYGRITLGSWETTVVTKVGRCGTMGDQEQVEDRADQQEVSGRTCHGHRWNRLGHRIWYLYPS